MKKLLLILLCLPIIYLSSCSKSDSNEDYVGYNCVDGSCVGVFTNPQYLSLNSCDGLCGTDSVVINSDSVATYIVGCTDSLATNYNPLATIDDDSCEYGIQEVYVNIIIDLSLPEYSDLQVSGNSIFITGGVKGIIIYHEVGNNYKVYDRNCSYEPSLVCSYIDIVNSGIAYCGCCTSAFLLAQDGAAANSPALLPLKEYYWTLSGSQMHISN